MSLLRKLPALREMERKAHKAPIGIARVGFDSGALLQLYADPDDRVGSSNFSASHEDKCLLRDLRNAALAMLEVLACIEEHDSALIQIIKELLIVSGVNCGSPVMDAVNRWEKMCKLMEAEG